MKKNELKDRFHKLIDEFENERMLKQVYEILNSYRSANKTEEDFWDQLTPTQQKELELAWEESEIEENLIDHDEVMKAAQGWLKK